MSKRTLGYLFVLLYKIFHLCVFCLSLDLLDGKTSTLHSYVVGFQLQIRGRVLNLAEGEVLSEPKQYSIAKNSS